MKHNLCWFHFLWQNKVQLLMSSPYKVSFISGTKGANLCTAVFIIIINSHFLCYQNIQKWLGDPYSHMALILGEKWNSFIIISQQRRTLRARSGWPQSRAHRILRTKLPFSFPAMRASDKASPGVRLRCRANKTYFPHPRGLPGSFE